MKNSDNTMSLRFCSATIRQLRKHVWCGCALQSSTSVLYISSVRPLLISYEAVFKKD